VLNFLTTSEELKVNEITRRLREIASPVLRLQAILQYSQIVDILQIALSSVCIVLSIAILIMVLKRKEK